MGIMHKAPGSTAGKMAPAKKGSSIQNGKSMPNNFAIGSGSRPTKGKVPIHTTSPHHPHGLDSRMVKGALGQGKK